MNGDEFVVNAAGQAYLDLYHTEWNSTGVLEVSADGTFKARWDHLTQIRGFPRGFHGEYRAVVTYRGQELGATTLTLLPGQNTDVTVKLN